MTLTTNLLLLQNVDMDLTKLLQGSVVLQQPAFVMRQK